MYLLYFNQIKPPPHPLLTHSLSHPAPFVEVTFLSLLDSLAFDHIHKGVLLGSLFCSMGLMSSLCQYHTVSSLLVGFGIRKYEVSSCDFLSQDCFGGPLKFHINFRMGDHNCFYSM
jgi:hypothetical protein